MFDTALKDFNFTSIFSENKFSGGDRINDANQITAAAITRLINPATGAEQVCARCSDSATTSSASSVTSGQALPTTPVPSNDRAEQRVPLGLLAAFSGSLTRNWSLDTGVQYGVNNPRSSASTSRCAISPSRAR